MLHTLRPLKMAITVISALSLYEELYVGNSVESNA